MFVEFAFLLLTTGVTCIFSSNMFSIFQKIRNNSEICLCHFKRIRFVYDPPKMRDTMCYYS